MQAQEGRYIVTINKSTQELNVGDMQEYVIQNGGKGEFFHTNLKQIRIEYDTQDGKVRMEDWKKPNFDFTNAYQAQRKEVEEGIRRCVKERFINFLNGMGDPLSCKIITRCHGIDPATGKIREHTSELELDMSLLRIIKLGYPYRYGGVIFDMVFFVAKENKPTQVQIAVYKAFEDFKKIYPCGSHALDQIKSINAVQKFKNLIFEHLKLKSEVVKAPQSKR